MLNIFENATKNKFRFNYKGLVTVEDLWDLDVIELDNIFKELNASKKQLSEDSLLEIETKADTLVNNKIKIIKYIVETKLAEAEARKTLAERKIKKEKIMEILAAKQDDALANKSTKELQKMLNEL